MCALERVMHRGALVYLSHRGPPEVIEEQVVKRGCGPQVLIVKDCGDIIKHKATCQAVPVAPHHQSSQKQDLLP